MTIAGWLRAADAGSARDGGPRDRDAAAPGADAGTTPPDDGGCGCRVGSREGAPLSLLALLGAAALLRRRRRR